MMLQVITVVMSHLTGTETKSNSPLLFLPLNPVQNDNKNNQKRINYLYITLTHLPEHLSLLVVSERLRHRKLHSGPSTLRRPIPTSFVPSATSFVV